MKKYTLASIFLIGIFSTCFAADLSRYQNVRHVEELKVTQPAIVELSRLDSSRVYVVATLQGETIQQQFQTIRTTRVILPTKVEACMTVCTPALALADTNQDTTFDFPLTTVGTQKGVIKITYAKPLVTDRIVFQVTGDSYMPNAFTLMIDGKRILNTIEGSAAKFPQMSAQNVEIAFEYSQPIRFREVGVGVTTEEDVNNMIRFVYQPNTEYILYTGVGIGREDTPTPPINLFAKNKEASPALTDEEKNTLYVVKAPEKNKDTDNDGVIDLTDNCPLQANADQKDSNGNGVGDVCDDYDYDGVETYRDNCPTISNFDQLDTDRDGAGDTCDQEESRFTERNKWVPWAAFIVVFLGILGMGYEVTRKIKEGGKK